MLTKKIPTLIVKNGKPSFILKSNKNPAIQGPIKFDSSKRITNPAFAATI